MAHQQTKATPVKEHGFNTAGMNPDTSRHSNALGFANLNPYNTNATTIKPFLTPHKSSTLRDDSDDGDQGGGAKLTPQPRATKSEKIPRFQDFDDNTKRSGSVGLFPSRPKAQASSLATPATKRFGKSVAFVNAIAKRMEESETDNEREFQTEGNDDSSDDEAHTVATSTKTIFTSLSDGYHGSSPYTMVSPAHSSTTPKTTGWTGQDATQFVKSVPARFTPRPETRRGLTNEPPPAFDLTGSLNDVVEKVINNARQAQAGQGSSNSAGAGYSSGNVQGHGVTNNMYQTKPTYPSPFKGAGGSPFKATDVSPFQASSVLARQEHSHYGLLRHHPLSSPGSVASSPFKTGRNHRDSISSLAGSSPGQLQKRHDPQNNVGLQHLFEQLRETFPKLTLAQLNSQPTDFAITEGASAMLNMITTGFTARPSMDLAYSPEYEPFIQNALQPRESGHHVIKIDDLPYEAKISDIIAFVGGNAKILNDNEEPVHIMMERITAKTGSAYVEFYCFQSAIGVVTKQREAKANGKPVRIDTRIVNVTVSSQDELLKDLFPYARDVDWVQGHPYIRDPANFKGFVTEEELIQLVKNVEFPHRVSFNPLVSRCSDLKTNNITQVPYTKTCPQRSVETLISILKKMPWHMTELITLGRRYKIYKCLIDMLKALAHAVYGTGPVVYNNDVPDPHRQLMENRREVLNEKLLGRLVHAGMSCPGFTPLMKDNIAFVHGMEAKDSHKYKQPPMANGWRHMYALTRNPDVPADVIEVCSCSAPTSHIILNIWLVLHRYHP